MATERRRSAIDAVMQAGEVRVVAFACVGGTVFVDPFCSSAAPSEDRYLGTRELFMKFEGVRDSRGRDEGWTLALMEMLVDPMLRQWVPAWVIEQYERQNAFFKEVITELQGENIDRNMRLLKRTKREMIRRKELHEKRKQQENDRASSDSGGEERSRSAESAAPTPLLRAARPQPT